MSMDADAGAQIKRDAYIAILDIRDFLLGFAKKQQELGNGNG